VDLKKIVDLSGKTAIITGGAGLLGRVYASTLLENGAKVIALDKKINQNFVINQIKNEFKLDQKKIKNLKLIQCDITDSKQINNIFQELSEIKNLKILVNNASLVKQVGKDNLVDSYKTFLEMKPNDWEEFFSVDLTGTLLMSQKVIPYMQKNGGGSIINISSTYGILSPDQRLYKHFNDNLSAKEKKMGVKIEKPIGYSISKSGILNLTRFLATKFAKDSIRVNTLTLGGVEDNNPPKFVKAYSERTPLGRMADKKEYSGPLLFLASEMSSYMTGSNLIVDGGWSAW
jgi:NAD(P)-dependent dehydrogenase (short-subunit alcohol dehydrogenase family)|tara:strand:+ start:9844 stop:10707 length:864 start_codon:yes stop_codon:yes gene_type:complete